MDVVMREAINLPGSGWPYLYCKVIFILKIEIFIYTESSPDFAILDSVLNL